VAASARASIAARRTASTMLCGVAQGDVDVEDRGQYVCGYLFNGRQLAYRID
jgi:hypothetical protein